MLVEERESKSHFYSFKILTFQHSISLIKLKLIKVNSFRNKINFIDN